MKIFSLVIIFCVLPKKFLFISQSQRYLCFSHKSFIVLCFLFRLVTHFKLINVWCEIGIEVHLFPSGFLVVLTPFVEKAVSNLLNYFSTFVKKISLPCKSWSFSSSFDSVSLVSLSLCQSHTILILILVVLYYKVESMQWSLSVSPSTGFFFKIVLAILELWHYCINFRIHVSFHKSLLV